MHTSQTLLDLLLKGGWFMLPLAFLSLISLYIIVERLLIYRKYLNFSSSFLETVETALSDGDMATLQQICREQDNIIQKVINQGIEQRKTANVPLILESESSRMVAFLEEKLSFLATIAGVAPMIGFLGTVTGMIQAFIGISQAKYDISVLSSGIYEAMITTVAGLMVGIIAYLGYNYFVARVSKTTARLIYLVNLFLAKV